MGLVAGSYAVGVQDRLDRPARVLGDLRGTGRAAIPKPRLLPLNEGKPGSVRVEQTKDVLHLRVDGAVATKDGLLGTAFQGQGRLRASRARQRRERLTDNGRLQH